jgi:hypothetical protein
MADLHQDARGRVFNSHNSVLFLLIIEAVRKKLHTRRRRLCDVTKKSLASRLSVNVQLVLYQFQGHSTVSGHYFTRLQVSFEGFDSLLSSHRISH